MSSESIDNLIRYNLARSALLRAESRSQYLHAFLDQMRVRIRLLEKESNQADEEVEKCFDRVEEARQRACEEVESRYSDLQ